MHTVTRTYMSLSITGTCWYMCHSKLHHLGHTFELAFLMPLSSYVCWQRPHGQWRLLCLNVCCLQVKHASLHFNALTSLPPGIAGCSSLVWLSLNANKLTELPDEICGMTSLVRLSLHINQVGRMQQQCYTLLQCIWAATQHCPNRDAEALRVAIAHGLSVHTCQDIVDSRVCVVRASEPFTDTRA